MPFKREIINTSYLLELDLNSESFNGVLNSIEITLAYSKLKVITVIVTPDSISIQQSLSYKSQPSDYTIQGLKNSKLFACQQPIKNSLVCKGLQASSLEVERESV